MRTRGRATQRGGDNIRVQVVRCSTALESKTGDQAKKRKEVKTKDTLSKIRGERTEELRGERTDGCAVCLSKDQGLRFMDQISSFFSSPLRFWQ